VWTLLNRQARVRKAPNEQFDSPDLDANGINNVDEASCFYGNPSQYDWNYIEKKEMLVPIIATTSCPTAYSNSLGRIFQIPILSVGKSIVPGLSRRHYIQVSAM
jgi:hypothetical protein